MPWERVHGVAINPASFQGRGENAGHGRRGTPGDNHRERRPRDIAEQVKSLPTYPVSPPSRTMGLYLLYFKLEVKAAYSKIKYYCKTLEVYIFQISNKTINIYYANVRFTKAKLNKYPIYQSH